jgi:hypothetical protein
MESQSFAPFSEAIFYRTSDNTAIFDLNERNVLFHDGRLFPIDAVVVRPWQELREAIEREIE